MSARDVIVVHMLFLRHVCFAVWFHHIMSECKSIVSNSEVWDIPALQNVAVIRLALGWSWVTRIAVHFVI